MQIVVNQPHTSYIDYFNRNELLNHEKYLEAALSLIFQTLAKNRQK